MNRLLRLLPAVAALLFSSAAARAVPTFDQEAAVSFSSAAPQAFTFTAPAASYTYPIRMYFIRPSSGVEVGTASSADGVSWTEDPAAGRVSTTTLPSVSASSITGCGVLPLTGGGFRMLYSIVSTTGAYRIHSATSSDGLAWANDTGTRIDNGSVFLASPKLVPLSDGSWRLYFVGDSSGTKEVFTSRSTDQGWTWTSPAVAMSTIAYELGASVLTNGKVRLYFTEPLAGSSSATVILSALSTDTGGASFTVESGYRASTATASGSLSFPVPVRSTDSFRWRLYYDFSDPGVVSTASVRSALTGAPAPSALSPSYLINATSTNTLTITGDVFSSPAPTLRLSYGASTLSPLSVTRVDDQTLTASFNIQGATPGRWDLTVTNADALTGTLTRGLTIDFLGGTVALVNNLLRPRTGGSTSITLSTFNAGHVVVRLYALDGRPIKTLFDGEQAAGTLALSWDGRDSGGAVVASGVYLLRVIAPKVDVKDKIVVIR
jgi:hypothetical protein